MRGKNQQQPIILSPEAAAGSTPPTTTLIILSCLLKYKWTVISQLCDVKYLAKDYLATIISVLRFSTLFSGSIDNSLSE